ncbi:hypothetical protein LCGC14_2448890 [marine sediment metagenome]|uniref:Uncharacterized protein n=1 Tax=marine sediment metagenome TaxID=412755 RepID=A0A0F9EAK8_9ZZZZ
MSEITWRLSHPGEFFWEPIMKWWHRNRQARIERDYWEAEFERLDHWTAEHLDKCSLPSERYK